MKTLMIIWVISLILSAVALALALVVRIKLKKRLTRFEKFTCCETELVDLLEEVYGLDPYTDDSPWVTDGYKTCKEWLKSEVGQQGTYLWREQTPTNGEDVSEEVRQYYHEALVKNIASVNMLFDSMHNKIDGRVVEFAPCKPLPTTEENSEE